MILIDIITIFAIFVGVFLTIFFSGLLMILFKEEELSALKCGVFIGLFSIIIALLIYY